MSHQASSPFGLSQAADLLEQHFGMTGQLHPLPGELDLNYRLDGEEGRFYAFKISRPDSDLASFQFQTALLQHLRRKQLPLQLPYPVAGRNGQHEVCLEGAEEARVLRLLEWVPGQLLAKAKSHSPSLLKSIGTACAHVCLGLRDFEHEGAHRSFRWNLADALWIESERAVIPAGEQRDLFDHFLALYKQEVLPRWGDLRQQVIYNDANDYNLLVGGRLADRHISGLIDFGDAVFAPLVGEVAIACAYAMMDKRDPLAAALAVVDGFQEVYPLQEAELAVLFPLIAVRLLVSVTVSRINAVAEPDNDYLQISARPAWQLLRQWKEIHHELAHYSFRHIGGYSACPMEERFQKWVQTTSFHPVIQLEGKRLSFLDLSVGSLDLGHNENFEDSRTFERHIDQLLAQQQADVGIGGYGEIRPVYTTDAYLVRTDQGPRWRTVHLGIDLWVEAGTPVYAPLAGQVKSVVDNAGERNYGPTLILEHETDQGLTFYSLYGHLAHEFPDGIAAGELVEAGQPIARVGAAPGNGNWPPHLHFQLMLDLLGEEGDFPGVAFPESAAIWKSICPDPAPLLLLGTDVERLMAHRKAMRPPALTHLLESRREQLGLGMSISYQHPLIVPRAYRQYLYDDRGRRFLDTVNNVAHVGHQHPRVVAAARRQQNLLNTNTRYLHPRILEYAEALLATFPPELCVVHFVNSGSEANELALRMAKTCSGQQDVIAVEVGYHGNTGACIDVSSYKFDGKGGAGAPPRTHIVPMPDVYRGLYRDPLTAGAQYAKHIQETIEQLVAEGKGPASFLCEGILSCGGQIVLPEGYLVEAFSAVRKRGGLCIVDEVQTGFGRVGEHFWAFELQGVVPDIVTLGKPIGNGHPLGAVVCTREVADRFANGMEFFNTFGGNPVSCSVGLEVLRVVQEEGLQQHAFDMGQLLTEGLRELQREFSVIGDVRGHGLFLGFELVRDREKLTPADDVASYIANSMRERGVLMSTDGPLHNVIKTKPPMCISSDNIAFLLEELRDVLQAVG
ncbi:MAG: aminotransferase class III-fold pyridoxal phosphate-dependent enzyme [Bacteroidota bacterium]